MAPANGRSRPGVSPVSVAGGLFLVSVGVHVAAMFPAYPGTPPTPIVSVPYLTAVYIILELGWALAAVLVLTRASIRGGLALAAGLGTVELGFVISDLASTGQVPARNAPGILAGYRRPGGRLCRCTGRGERGPDGAATAEPDRRLDESPGTGHRCRSTGRRCCFLAQLGPVPPGHFNRPDSDVHPRRRLLAAGRGNGR